MAVIPGIGDSTVVLDVGSVAITSALSRKTVGTHDSVEFSYKGDNISTVVFKNSGSAVATLTLTYSGNRLTQAVWT